MKSKGFTLTEVLAVIVILAILIGIGTPVYYTISNNTRNNEYNTKIEYLKTQAIKYAEETNVESSKTITVSTLVQNGYVVADNYIDDDGGEIPFIQNPQDSEDNLACRIINIGIDGYDRTAKVTEDSNCDLVVQEVLASELGIKAYNYERLANGSYKLTKEVDYDPSTSSFAWTNKDVLMIINPDYSSLVEARFTVEGSTKIIDKNDVYTTSSVGTIIDKLYTNMETITALSILRTSVSVNAQFNVNNEIVGKDVTTEVKIDKEEPIISSTSYSGWTSKDNDEQKTLSVYLSDGNGSGPFLAYLTKTADAREINDKNKYSVNESGQATVNHGYQESGSDIVPLLENGDYYIWGEDKVGNITTTPKKVTVTNVDKIPPKCIIRVIDSGNIVEQINNEGVKEFNNTGWTRNPITISYGCLDEESGCKIEMSGATKPFNNVSVGVHHLDEYVISDNAGNEVTCYPGGIDVDVYHDTIPPEDCPVGGEKTTWTNTPVTITYGCGDSGVGCDPARSGGYKVYPLEPTTLSIRQTVLPEWVVSDQLGNTKTCYPGGKTIDVYYDKKPPEIAPKVNPLGRNSQPYNTLDNINYSDPDSGIKSVACTPANTSEYGNTGVHPINCKAIDNMGNEATTTYTIKHQYQATYHRDVRWECVSSHDGEICDERGECASCCAGSYSCRLGGDPSDCWCNGGTCYNSCCTRSHRGSICDRSDWVDHSYYTCDVDTSMVYLSNGVCYYK